MYGALLLFEEEFIHVVSITFSALILTELLMVGLTVRTWHWLMVVAQVFSLGIYIASLAFFKDYFGKLRGWGWSKGAWVNLPSVMTVDLVALHVLF